ncbi:LysR family transcriptional regulator [Bradyrhizobium sp. USDA 4502]
MEANWDLFRLFFSVTRTGSVNRAARELGMSQPTLSRRLKELEQYMGAPLFFRVASGVKLTQEGEELRRVAGGLVESFESFQRDLSSRVGQRSGVIKISATEGLTKHWLLPRVRKLRALNEPIRLEINSTNTQQDLADRDLDFVIRVGDPVDDDLIGKRVATLAFGIFASSTYLAQYPAPLSFAELAHHDLIGRPADLRELQSERQTKLLARFREALRAQNGLRVTSITNHFAAASQGLGLAFLAVPFAHAEGLVRVLPEESSSQDIWLLRRRESDLRKLTRQARRVLESELSRSRAWFLGQQGVEEPDPRPKLSVLCPEMRNPGRKARRLSGKRLHLVPS